MPNWCHPAHAMRTKCACGAVIELRGAVGERGKGLCLRSETQQRAALGLCEGRSNHRRASCCWETQGRLERLVLE